MFFFFEKRRNWRNGLNLIKVLFFEILKSLHDLTKYHFWRKLENMRTCSPCIVNLKSKIILFVLNFDWYRSFSNTGSHNYSQAAIERLPVIKRDPSAPGCRLSATDLLASGHNCHLCLFQITKIEQFFILKNRDPIKETWRSCFDRKEGEISEEPHWEISLSDWEREIGSVSHARGERNDARRRKCRKRENITTKMRLLIRWISGKK